MLRLRPADQRGRADHGWLETRHTFSFGSYADPQHARFRVLRVMNEDWIAPGHGFGLHPHRDMEILTYVLEGELAHEDSLGSRGLLRAGELQRMTAGSGISHSESNPSPTQAVHLYQIWLLPRERGLPPSYEQRSFPRHERLNRWQLVAGPRGPGDALVIEQDACVYLAELTAGDALDYALAADRHAWLQVLRGQVELRGNDKPHAPGELGGQMLHAGDGAALSDERAFQLTAAAPAEVMLCDLP